MLMLSNIFNKTLSYPFQNNFSSKLNQIHSRYFYFAYQITIELDQAGLKK